MNMKTAAVPISSLLVRICTLRGGPDYILGTEFNNFSEVKER